MKIISILFIILFSSNVWARFEIQSATGYESNNDGKTSSSFSDLTNHLFLGASLDSKEKVIIGQNLSYLSNTYKTATTNKITTMELGPRLNYYLNEEQNFFLTLAWNPYAKGTRVVNGASEDISGWSYLAGIGAVLKMNKTFYLGASLNYHSLSVTKSIVGTTATTTTNSYSSLMPMINLTLRFH